MKKNWLRKGVSSAGFPWHGPEDTETRYAIVDPEQKLKQIWFLERALEASRFVGRVVFPDGDSFATCFLVAPNLILTNNHVFEAPEDTEGVKIEFGYCQTYDGGLTTPIRCTCDTRIFVTDEALDFTLVGLESLPNIGYLPLRPARAPQPPSHISIIQHPGGSPLQVAMRDNSLVYQEDRFMEYLTNTDYGSSGAPVFDDNWHVIALHSQRVRDPDITDATVWYRNRGTHISAILNNDEVNALIPA